MPPRFCPDCDELLRDAERPDDGDYVICPDCGAKVHDFPWCDDFAAARNQWHNYATGDWVFWMDADDRLDAGS